MEIKLTEIYRSQNTMRFQSLVDFRIWKEDGRINEMTEAIGVNDIKLEGKHTLLVTCVHPKILAHEITQINVMNLFNKLKNKSTKQSMMLECMNCIDSFIRKLIAEQDYEAIMALKTQINERFKNR